MIIYPGQSINVKWTGNNDPNAPEAAKVPRSQKYWDENNIERPDYAKTDTEIFQEKVMNGNGSKEESDGKSILLMIVFFVVLWGLIIKFGITKNSFGGNRLGSSGSSTKFTFGKSQGDDGLLKEKARTARLAKFEASVKND